MDNEIDEVICVGDLARYTYDELDNSNTLRYYFKNNDELLDKIDDVIINGDTILIKGSHGMNLLEVVEYLKK